MYNVLNILTRKDLFVLGRILLYTLRKKESKESSRKRLKTWCLLMGINIKRWTEGDGSHCVLVYVFFILKPGACVTYLQMKRKKKPLLVWWRDTETQEIPRKSLIFGGSDWGLLSQLVPLEPKYRVWRSGFELHLGPVTLILQPCFPFCIWDKAMPGFLSVSHWFPWPQAFPREGSHSVMSDSLQPGGL